MPAKKKTARKEEGDNRLHPEAMQSVWAVILIVAALVLVLAGIGYAGPVGRAVYGILSTLLGLGYVLLPAIMVFAAGVLFTSHRRKIVLTTFAGGLFMLLSALGVIDIFATGRGGWLGIILGSLRHPFGVPAATIINVAVFLIGIIIAANAPLRFRPQRSEEEPEGELVVTGESKEEAEEDVNTEPEVAPEPKTKKSKEKKKAEEPETMRARSVSMHAYTPPPLSLLDTKSERPTTGDLRANANVIKRTLESFGIAVEMGEVNIGPKVTRYTLKPAEGTKLSKIVALHQDLALALAAHPIRIEAPIPGKSLVGIEVPNKAAALVRLGSLMKYKDFDESGPLGFALGRDVSGEPVFADIRKMPHLLVAGSTGSGKSVTIHSIIVSLLYKNSPASLRLAMIDPKRVELSVYENIPHLVSPVITDNKKAVGVFRWAIGEMERRYDLLSSAGSRDLASYNKSHPKEQIPYIVIFVDELADLMTSFGREVEGFIVRLAQMARATGIHLVLSTQRPSVEIITGLIKANITARIALQVASQIDSRTILDTSGAEKLLGGGDLLFISSDLSKPKRIQAGFITEQEVKAVADFIRDKNEPPEEDEEPDFGEEKKIMRMPSLEESLNDEPEDDLYDEAVQVVIESKKASASLLQRRLKVGYARAARLIDLMEENGLVGPGEGAKAREVYVTDVEEE